MRRLMLVVMMLAALGFVGCGGGGDGGDGGGGDPIDANLLGTWQVYFTSIDGQQVGPAQAMDWDQGIVRMTIEFKNDRTVAIRHYGEEGLIETENGTWTAQSGNVTLSMDDEDIPLQYSFDGRVLVVEQQQDGTTIVMRFVPVVNLTAHAASLVRSWEVASVEVNGAAESLADFFGLPPDADGVVLQMGDDGTLNVFLYDGSDIVEHVAGTWANLGELLVIAPQSEGELRGVWSSNTSVTFLNTDGSTVTFELTQWAPTGTHASGLVGQWQAQSVTVNGSSASMADFFEWETGTAYMLLDLMADGTAISREMASANDILYGGLGTWNTDGGTMTLSFEGPMVMDSWSVVGNTLTVEMTDDGDSIVLTWQRQAL